MILVENKAFNGLKIEDLDNETIGLQSLHMANEFWPQANITTMPVLCCAECFDRNVYEVADDRHTKHIQFVHLYC